MSLTVKEQRTGERQTTRISSRQRIRTFTVQSTNANDDNDIIEQASGLPRYGEPHPSSPGLYVNQIDSQHEGDSPYAWTVTVTYDRPGDPEEPGDPLDLTPKRQWSTLKSTEAIDQDINGTQIQNTSYEDFDPPLVADRSDLQLTISRWEPDDDPQKYLAYVDHANSDAWYGFPPGTVKCDSIVSTEERVGGRLLWQVTYVFVMRKGRAAGGHDWWAIPGGFSASLYSYIGHGVRVCNRGKRYPTQDDTGWVTDAFGAQQFTTIKDADDNPITEPVPINISGFPVAKGEPIEWLVWQVYPPVAFAALGLEW